jgi:serine/threonine-protein kinase
VPDEPRTKVPGDTESQRTTPAGADVRRIARTEPGGEPMGDPYLGQTIAGRYKVLRKLGEGGMGVVYLAEHILIEKKVALKILSDDLMAQRDLVARFAQEAKAASKIGHENIVDITDFGDTARGTAFIAMEFLEGTDLARHIRARGALPAQRSARIMYQVCRALAAAHGKGIVHRDLKPDNIFLIDREGKTDFIKVLDFGIAKVTSTVEGEKLTRAGTIFGTAEYMSPEQARGEVADHRTDIYAAGCILYEMLTGNVPFTANSFMSVLRKQLEDAPEPPAQRAPDAQIAAPLEAVVLKALAKDRESRFQTMKELALALAAAVGDDAKLAWGTQEDAAPQTVRVTPSRLQGKARANEAPTQPPRSKPLLYAFALLPIAIFGAWLGLRKPARTAAFVPAPVPAPPSASPPFPAPAPVPAKPALSRVEIVSDPTDANVMNGPERLGRTPLVLELAPDSAPFDVTVEKKGHQDQKLHVSPDRSREYVVRLQPQRKTTPPARPTPAPPPVAQQPKPSEPKPADPPRRKNPELKDVLAD